MSWWTDLADDYVTAYRNLFGGLPSRDQVLYAMAVAEFETNNGRAWPRTYNFGAVQLRTPTTAEQAEISSGALQAGSVLPASGGKPGGVLHEDTHPASGPYWVWFAAFPNQLDGVTYFLQTLYSRDGCNSAGSIEDLVSCMYLHCYFEGSTPGARPCGSRSIPFTAPEQANVDAYVGYVTRTYGAVSSNVGGWVPEDKPPRPQVNDGLVLGAGEPANRDGIQAGSSALRTALGWAFGLMALGSGIWWYRRPLMKIIKRARA